MFNEFIYQLQFFFNFFFITLSKIKKIKFSLKQKEFIYLQFWV